MQVLYIPSWFPSTKNPLAGSFIKELAADLASSEIEIVVAAFHQNFTDIQGSYTEIENISQFLKVHHHFGWSFPKINKFAQNSWINTCIEDLDLLIEENNFDFIYDGKETVAFNFSKAKGVEFTASEENKLYYNLFIYIYFLNMVCSNNEIKSQAL